MKTLCRSYMGWPGLDRDIEKLIQSCEACLQCRSKSARTKLVKWEEVEYTIDWIHMNFLYLQGKNV